ncbi:MULTISPECIES: ROK family transcriptional regulator [Roseobacter]|uniref:ROK family transcriptional regulator n=1 Tax=Roseobacter TaxID=2433 RepID=UPI001BBCE952|nr:MULTISPECIES: ROK family transcriptional regulator [Roseobacter]GIT85276.1 sugar kinase [Roseobacter sp. OBYS 0001]
MTQSPVIRALNHGANQKGLRDYNERLILSVLHRHGDLPGSEIARKTKLSAQTVSVILRKLEGDGLVTKGRPSKGRVGKPSVPMALNPKGAISVGCKLGRRGSDVLLTDLNGQILFRKHIQYDLALPHEVFAFFRDAFFDGVEHIGPELAGKLCGIGIAAPFEIWKWGASDGNTPEEFLSWKDVSFESEVAQFTDLPLYMVNDATSACWAEQIYGRGKAMDNFAYFFVSTFIGGGIVLGNSVYEGKLGNAGAFGPLRVGNKAGQTRQLLDVASLHVLETRLTQTGHDPKQLWSQPQDWDKFSAHVAPWIDETAHGIAQACISACSVIDFESVLIDGYFPDWVRSALVEAVAAYVGKEDSRGLILPNILAGQVGSEARGIGAACVPVFSQYFLVSKPMVSNGHF